METEIGQASPGQDGPGQDSPAQAAERSTAGAVGWQGGDYGARPLNDLLDDVGSAAPVPAAGSVTAVTLALAASLTAKVARRSRLDDGKSLAAGADEWSWRMSGLATADAALYAEVLSTARSGSDEEAAEALTAAAELPADMAEAGTEIAAIAADLAARGNPNLRFDAVAAVDLAASSSAVAASLASADGGGTLVAARAVSAASRAEAIAAAVRRG